MRRSAHSNPSPPTHPAPSRVPLSSHPAPVPPPPSWTNPKRSHLPPPSLSPATPAPRPPSAPAAAIASPPAPRGQQAQQQQAAGAPPASQRLHVQATPLTRKQQTVYAALPAAFAKTGDKPPHSTEPNTSTRSTRQSSSSSTTTTTPPSPQPVPARAPSPVSPPHTQRPAPAAPTPTLTFRRVRKDSRAILNSLQAQQRQQPPPAPPSTPPPLAPPHQLDTQTPQHTGPAPSPAQSGAPPQGHAGAVTYCQRPRPRGVRDQAQAHGSMLLGRGRIAVMSATVVAGDVDSLSPATPSPAGHGAGSNSNGSSSDSNGSSNSSHSHSQPSNNNSGNGSSSTPASTTFHQLPGSSPPPEAQPPVLWVCISQQQPEPSCPAHVYLLRHQPPPADPSHAGQPAAAAAVGPGVEALLGDMAAVSAPVATLTGHTFLNCRQRLGSWYLYRLTVDAGDFGAEDADVLFPNRLVLEPAAAGAGRAGERDGEEEEEEGEEEGEEDGERAVERSFDGDSGSQGEASTALLGPEAVQQLGGGGGGGGGGFGARPAAARFLYDAASLQHVGAWLADATLEGVHAHLTNLATLRIRRDASSSSGAVGGSPGSSGGVRPAGEELGGGGSWGAVLQQAFRVRTAATAAGWAPLSVPGGESGLTAGEVAVLGVREHVQGVRSRLPGGGAGPGRVWKGGAWCYRRLQETWGAEALAGLGVSRRYVSGWIMRLQDAWEAIEAEELLLAQEAAGAEAEEVDVGEV